jgi:indolepyruvate decarboxylase
MHHNVRVGYATYHGVLMKELLAALAARAPRKNGFPVPKVHGLGAPVGGPTDVIAPAYFYPRCEQFLRGGDILIAETSTASMGLSFARMPRGAAFHTQALWGAIGWATPAALGAAVADPDRRTILVTGEGAHQVTAQEVGQFARYGLKPIIFCLSNGGYLVERLLSRNPTFPYNDVAPWKYHLLPEALGCEGWFTARVATCGELDAAMKTAEACGAGAYLEVVMDPAAAPPLVEKLCEAMRKSCGP